MPIPSSLFRFLFATALCSPVLASAAPIESQILTVTVHDYKFRDGNMLPAAHAGMETMPSNLRSRPDVTHYFPTYFEMLLDWNAPMQFNDRTLIQITPRIEAGVIKIYGLIRFRQYVGVSKVNGVSVDEFKSREFEFDTEANDPKKPIAIDLADPKRRFVIGVQRGASEPKKSP